MATPIVFHDRAYGALLGLALGDSYGRTLEFLSIPEVRQRPVDTYQLHWTDDTHMSMYLAQALLSLPPGTCAANEFGPALARQWLKWLEDPLTPDTAPGRTCLSAARNLAMGATWEHAGIPTSDGCGALMRIAPLPIALDGPLLTTAARVSAFSTHAHPNAMEAAIAGAWLLRWTLEEGVFSAELVERAIQKLRGEWSAEGDVARSLEDALKVGKREGEWLEEAEIWPGDGGWRSGSALGLAVAGVLRWGNDFATTVDKCARIAGDSDSVAAIAGMFVGGAKGRGALPNDWRLGLFRRTELELLAAQLLAWGEGRSPLATPGEKARTSRSHPIEVAWVPTPLNGRIGVTFAPGKRGGSLSGSEWDRDLGADLDRLVAVHRADLLVPLIEDFELKDLGIPNLVEEAERRGLVVWRHPIPDGGTPTPEMARRTVDMVLRFARAGRRVVIHCRGGLGRAGTLASCSLVALGLTPEEAIAATRQVRPGAVENVGQERFIEQFRR